MAVFYVFKIVQMVPNHATHHVISMLLVLSDNYLSFCQVYAVMRWLWAKPENKCNPSPACLYL